MTLLCYRPAEKEKEKKRGEKRGEVSRVPWEKTAIQVSPSLQEKKRGKGERGGGIGLLGENSPIHSSYSLSKKRGKREKNARESKSIKHRAFL